MTAPTLRPGGLHARVCPPRRDPLKGLTPAQIRVLQRKARSVRAKGYGWERVRRTVNIGLKVLHEWEAAGAPDGTPWKVGVYQDKRRQAAFGAPEVQAELLAEADRQVEANLAKERAQLEKLRRRCTSGRLVTIQGYQVVCTAITAGPVCGCCGGPRLTGDEEESC